MSSIEPVEILTVGEARKLAKENQEEYADELKEEMNEERARVDKKLRKKARKAFAFPIELETKSDEPYVWNVICEEYRRAGWYVIHTTTQVTDLIDRYEYVFSDKPFE